MSVWSSQTKNSSSWTSENKNLGGLGYLLLEDGFFMLQENLDKLILDQTSAGGVVWSTQTKS